MNHLPIVPDFLFDEEGNSYRVYKSLHSEYATNAPELRHTKPGHWATVPLFRIAEVPGITITVQNAAGQDVTDVGQRAGEAIREQLAKAATAKPDEPLVMSGPSELQERIMLIEPEEDLPIGTLEFQNPDGTTMAVLASSIVAVESLYRPDDKSLIKVYFAVGGVDYTAEIEDIAEGELNPLFDTIHAGWLESME